MFDFTQPNALETIIETQDDTGKDAPVPDPVVPTSPEGVRPITHTEKLDRERGSLDYKELLPKVVSGLRRRVRTHEDAEDATQEAALRQHVKNLIPEKPLAWLSSVGWRKYLERLRNEQRGNPKWVAMPQEVQGNTRDPAAALLEAEMFEAMAQAVRELTGKASEYWRLCKVEGKTQAEAAVIMGIKPSAVKTLASRVGKKLVTIMAKRGYELG